MARRKAPRIVTLRARVSFDDWRLGDTLTTTLTPRAAALVAAGKLEIVGDVGVFDGTGEARPAGADADDSGGGPEGSEAEGSAGAEPGEDPGAGGHGAAAE